MTNEFMREDRYIVFKMSDVEEHFTPGEKQQLARLVEVQRVGREEAGKAPLECVVVESDWPEYEPTWNAIEARMTGAQPAPSIPDGWLRAIDEALVVAHIGVANESDTYEQAKAKLDTLIGLHVDIATDPAVNGGWKLVPVEILDRFPEINQNNYNHDDVCNLNAWGVELVLAAAPEAKP